MESFTTSVVVLLLGFICTTNAYNAAVDDQFHLFTRRNPTVSQPLLNGNAGILAASNYDPSLKTFVSIHGWSGNATDDYNQIVVPAILAHDDVNVIVVDWNIGSLSHAILECGQNVAKFISWLKLSSGQPAEDFHIVGFSLGVHTAGVTGRFVDGGVGHITACDPGQSYQVEEARFRPDDGLYTEVIYSNSGGLSYVGNLGHVNYYPNGGSSMPGCGGVNLCNHYRAVFYWAEAIVSGGFTATECASYEDAIIGNCDLPGRLQIGSYNVGVRGTYYLQTNAAPPFSIY